MQTQTQLFSLQAHTLDLRDADIEYHPEFVAEEAAWKLFERLRVEVPWRQETIRLYNKSHLVPRLSCWMGDAGLDYAYSNMTMHPVAWSDTTKRLLREIEALSQHQFNSVLLNYYRNGQDSVGWHSDDESELGQNPVIASLSLGASRDFHLKHRNKPKLRHSIALEHGSLLLMQGATQHNWRHQVPKRTHALGRINLTFRLIQA
jgi:alkylated DNA repair dioxygenase AlkB